MSKRQRFRPGWTGAYETLRQMYAAGRITKGWYTAWGDHCYKHGAPVHSMAKMPDPCDKEHAYVGLPPQVGSEEYRRWVELGQEAANCPRCTLIDALLEHKEACS